MRFREWDQTLRDGTKLHMYEWKPSDAKKIKGVVQLVHGSAEYAKRYDEFAKYMVENDYAVVADDHRGHGKTAKTKEDLGFFDDFDGWEIIIDDLTEVTQYIKMTYKNKPIVMFGHSMGSFMVRQYIIEYGQYIKAAVLCGTAYHNKLVLRIGIMIAKHDQNKFGSKEKDQFLYNLSYGKLNKHFAKEGATGVEWLTSDKKVQKAFKKDPLCGQVFSTSAFKDMFTGLLFINSKKNIKKGPKNLPIFFISGEDDPVGNFSKGVRRVYKMFKKLKFTNLSFKLYSHGRHEILNEPFKTDVFQDILVFYNQFIK